VAQTHFRPQQSGGEKHKPHEAGSLNKTVIELSLLTGIPMSEWRAVGLRGIKTAIEILEEQHEQANRDLRRR
jgi:hypothetical protein